MKYPFNPEILDAMPEELAELFRGLEGTLIEEICSRLKAADQLNEVTVDAIRALRSHGISMEEIEKAIQEVSGISQKKLDALLDDVVQRNQSFYTELATLSSITAPDSFVSASDIESIYRQTKGELRNLTQSMGFLVRERGKVQKGLPPAKAYQWVLDQAEMQVMSGAISYNQAIATATKQLADSGLRRVYYEHDGIGHYEQVDVVARRAVMTGVNQLCQKYAEQSVEYLGTDLVEVSAHKGARNTGFGPANHQSWQGKVYRWKRDDAAADYPDFLKVTGYGSGEGLGGWNCRHHFYPFIEGVMERTYTDEQLESMDNPPFPYEGKTYDQYAASQKQREIERTIRKYKREQIAFEAAGLKEEATAVKIRLRRLNTKYNEFSKAAGLPTQRERLRVLDAAKKQTGTTYESDILIRARRAAKSVVSGNKVVAFSELPDKMKTKFRDGLAKADPDVKAALRKVYSSTDYSIGDVKKASYSGGVITIGIDSASSTMAHELFHKLDREKNISQNLVESVALDKATLTVLSGGNDKDFLYKRYPNAFTKSKKGTIVVKKEYRGIGDLLNGFSGGRVQYGYGHERSYWAKPGSLESEAWAQYGRIYYENNQEVVALFEELFPNLVKKAKEEIRRL